MEFILTYEGALSTTKHVAGKFKSRRHFLDQLKGLDAYFKENRLLIDHGFSTEKIRFVGDFKFLPLVTRNCKKVVDLDIVILSPCEPACCKQFPTGDTDNLLKALIDSLRMANNMNEVRNEKPLPDEDLFYTVVEDDQIIRNINIRHDRLLSQDKKKSVFALIKVSIHNKFAI